MNVHELSTVPHRHWPEGITQEQKTILTTNGFFVPRFVSGKLCALHQYFSTVGLVVGIHDWGYERRYCYRDPLEALQALMQYEDETEHASGNWIKCKGQFNGVPIDLLNPKIGTFE